MTTTTPCPGGLADRTTETLRTFFDQQNHHPSKDHWLALQDIADSLEDMADCTCDPKVFLSAVDPGVGKTQTVAHFARALTQDARYADVGMIVCVGRIAEAVSLARDLGLPRERLAVLTANDEANALGNPDARAAQVLITTQQRIERACDGRTFADVEAFHYGRHGARQVRVWDEAWLPGCAVTLGRDDILLLIRPLRRVCAALADGLLSFAVRLADVEDGAAVDVPDFAAVYGVSLHEVLATIIGQTGNLRDDQQVAATALLTLSGRRARVRKDGATGAAILSYRDTLPSDLAPLLVLDASGRVRQTYSYIEAKRRTLERLREAVKDYSPLTIHTWRTAGSKSGFDRQGDALIAGIAEAIKTKPDERWLCVVHKSTAKVRDVAARIMRAIPKDMRANVETITWGQHMATNLYADVPNVILAGTLFMRQSHYTALTHLAQDFDTADGLASPEDVTLTIRGENANLVLQALCRGRVRKSNGAQCFPMTAYIIAAQRSGIPDDIATIFPGCVVKDWQGHKRVLTGRADEALKFITAMLRDTAWVSYSDVARALKMDKSGFRKLVLKHPLWAKTIADCHLEEAVGSPRNARGVRRAINETLKMAA